MVDKKERYSKESGNTCGSEAPAISSAWRKVWLPVCCAHWESRWTWLPERLWCWGSWYPFNWFDGHEQRLFWVILGWVLFSCLRLVVWVALRLSMLGILFSGQIQTGSQNFSNQLNTNFYFLPARWATGTPLPQSCFLCVTVGRCCATMTLTSMKNYTGRYRKFWFVTHAVGGNQWGDGGDWRD